VSPDCSFGDVVLENTFHVMAPLFFCSVMIVALLCDGMIVAVDEN
jgi:hypothetical protein